MTTATSSTTSAQSVVIHAGKRPEIITLLLEDGGKVMATVMSKRIHPGAPMRVVIKANIRGMDVTGNSENIQGALEEISMLSGHNVRIIPQ